MSDTLVNESSFLETRTRLHIRLETTYLNLIVNIKQDKAEHDQEMLLECINYGYNSAENPDK